MIKSFFCLCLLVSLCFPVSPAWSAVVPSHEPFVGSVLTDGLEGPWEMLWGPDDMLWITESTGKRVTRVDPLSGDKRVALTIDEAFAGTQQGLLGMAFAPGMREDGGQVYLLYTYASQDGAKSSDFERVVRYEWDGKTGTLIDPQIIIDRIPAGSDHNGGRLVFGPDAKLYLSKGELGHNQNDHACLPIEAQRLPTHDELTVKDYSAYVGKILRMNPDGGIPVDNPVIGGVKSHIFTYGHRNPQGLVFVGDVLFSSEQGPSSDDEINILVSGGNYGWPHVAGYQDDNAYVYANWSAAPDCPRLKFDANVIPDGVPTQKESDWEPVNFHPPAKTFYTVPQGYDFNDERCSSMPYLCWPTIAPASVTWYPADGPIPGWSDSLLVTSLKNGALYKMRLGSNGKQIQGDVTTHFHTPNRYRVARVSPDGKTIFIATDNGGNVMDMDGKPIQKMANPGAILKFEYIDDEM